jgi:putative ATP-dependent endonuclease of OLD family
VKLAKLKIRNFRSFGDEEIIINFDIITTFIGANSTGKTATMQALVKLFGATLSEREIHRSDFHIEPSQLPEQLENCELYIEAVFVFPELENASDSTASIPSFFRYFVVDEQTKPPYLRIRLESSFLRDDTPEGSIDTQYSFITSSEKDDSITDQVRKPIQRYIMSNIKCIYIPALRDPSEQLRHVSGTILYRLLSGIRWSSDVKEKLTDLVSDLNNAYGAVPGVIELQDIIQTEWKKYHNDFRYSDAKIVFSATDISEILKKAEIKFSPTEIPRAYDVIELGDGLRSLFYFSLVNSLLNLESKILTTLSKQPTVEDQQGPQYTLQPPILTIVAVEEPENHIAPQLLGKVINNLEDMVNHANAQVILSSHTPAIVKRVDATSIRYFRLAEISQATIVKKISLPDKIIDNGNIYKYVKEGIEAYPEIYFARLVILGEGDSEALVIPRLFEKTKGSIDSFGISVVPLGGRHVNYFWKLLSDLC